MLSSTPTRRLGSGRRAWVALTGVVLRSIVDNSGGRGLLYEGGHHEPAAFPLSVRARFDQPGRWLWLVKWLLLIPHYIILFFLWLAFVIVTVIAFFAILFTTRYPRGLFDFNLGVLRWSWRVGYYGYAALATDRYPPFTLADVRDYPARLEIDYPRQLNRWLPLIKWLLAVPHYLLIGALVGSGYAVGSGMDDHRTAAYSTPSLVGASVLIAAVALLFTARYPAGLFDLVVGIGRWGYRLVAYLAFLTDRYPPLRLDQGADDPEGPAEPAEAAQAAP
jgi:hypothetical protein